MTTMTGRAQRLRSAKKLLTSKSFVLVTDKEAVMFVDYEGLTAVMQLASLRSIRRNLGVTIKQAELELSKRRT